MQFAQSVHACFAYENRIFNAQLTWIKFSKHIRAKHEVAARCRKAELHCELIQRCVGGLHLEEADHLQKHRPIGLLHHDLKEKLMLNYYI